MWSSLEFFSPSSSWRLRWSPQQVLSIAISPQVWTQVQGSSPVLLMLKMFLISDHAQIFRAKLLVGSLLFPVGQILPRILPFSHTVFRGHPRTILLSHLFLLVRIGDAWVQGIGSKSLTHVKHRPYLAKWYYYLQS